MRLRSAARGASGPIFSFFRISRTSTYPGPMRIALIETGLCNTASICAALNRAGVLNERIDILGAGAQALASQISSDFFTHVILPGVGSFGSGMASLSSKNLADAIKARIEANLPTLAICLGLQTLCGSSSESPGVVGLGVLNSTSVVRFPQGVTVPQQTWNQVKPGAGGPP